MQILDYQYLLESMPNELQEEINAEFRKNNQVTFWSMLEFIGMAAGVAVNFASAASSIKDMLIKATNHYLEVLDVNTVSEIFTGGLLSREVKQLGEDLDTLLETKEWKATSSDTKSFIKSVTDFQGKILAYEKMLKKKKVTFEFDIIDVQAGILIFDFAKLELKKQKNEFEAYIITFLQDYDKAREWKHLFSDYFDTSETRFSLLSHLADVQAERRKLIYQRNLCEKNLATLKEQESSLDVKENDFFSDATLNSLESNLNLVLNDGLQKVMDEGRAFSIWTLEKHSFPAIPKGLRAETLRSKFHEPLWGKINTILSIKKLPAHRDYSNNPIVWKREEHPKQFEEFGKQGKILLSISPNSKSGIYFERIIDAKVYLRGATVQDESAFYCKLRHCGVSEFLDRKRKVTTCYQKSRAIEFSYREEGEDEQKRPVYDFQGAILEQFDTSDTLETIRYSPYATWELEVPKDYQQKVNGFVFNKGLDLSAVQSIELRLNVFFNSFGD